jgi:hypothetical protein
MAQGRSTKIILMIKWIRTSRLSIMKSVPLQIVPFDVDFSSNEIQLNYLYKYIFISYICIYTYMYSTYTYNV